MYGTGVGRSGGRHAGGKGRGEVGEGDRLDRQGTYRHVGSADGIHFPLAVK